MTDWLSKGREKVQAKLREWSETGEFTHDQLSFYRGAIGQELKVSAEDREQLALAMHFGRELAEQLEKREQ